MPGDLPIDATLAFPGAADEIARLRAEHDRRVTELLAANNREVERRRKAEAHERSLIVAWLEAEAWKLRAIPGGEVEATMAEDFAARIERGEHGGS